MWLAEGLLMYLPAEAEERLFEHIGALSATGSWLAVEHSRESPGLLESTAVAQARTEHSYDLTSLWSVDNRPFDGSRLTGQGWQVTDVPATRAAARYGRPRLDPRLAALPGAPLALADHVAFVTARREGPNPPQ